MSDLYSQRSNYYLSLSEQRIIIKNDNKEIVKEVSISLVDNVLLFGNAQLTTQLIKALSKNKVNGYYFSNVGQFISSIETHRQDEFQKQELQAKAYFEEDFRLEVARSIATTKVRHQIALLREFDTDGLLDTLDYSRFEDSVNDIQKAYSITEIMGYEGRLAKSYFYYLNLLVPDDFHFNGRSRRPAEDCFNSALNFGYSILYSCFMGLIKKNGLSLGFGVIHKHHQHHATLASDLMEEWRPIIVDNTLMELIRNGKLLLSHFENKDQDFILTDEGREIFARALRSRILEVHQYIELDKKRYSFLYTADRQIKSLIRAFRELDPSLYETSYTGGH